MNTSKTAAVIKSLFIDVYSSALTAVIVVQTKIGCKNHEKSMCLIFVPFVSHFVCFVMRAFLSLAGDPASIDAYLG